MATFTTLVVFFYAIFILRVSNAGDTITVDLVIRDGETITSVGGSFELGFFSPVDSNNRYVGIWYKKVSTRTVVWVANREFPLTDSSGVLKVTDQGTLVVLNGTNGIIWSSNSSQPAINPNVQLLESGNLVVKNGNDSDPEKFLWQSFDYPCDTVLPGMKFGRNTVTGLDRYLSSWKSTDDPSKGNFTYRLDPSGFPQLILRSGSAVTFCSGPWNGLRFSGCPEIRSNPVYKYSFVLNEKEIYYTYDLLNNSVITRLVLSPNGYVQRFTWIDRTRGWILYSSAHKDDCDSYALCGAYGSCNINHSPKCTCMKGFVPKFPNEWNMVDWSNGCVRSTPLDCHKGEGFVKYSGVKLPDTQYSWFNENMSLKECASICLGNCSCTAYANSDIRNGGSGCLLWFGDLIDIREFAENGQELYVRMAASELDAFSSSNSSSEKRRKQVIISSVSILGVLFLVVILTLYVVKKKKKLKRNGKIKHYLEGGEANERHEHLELPLFDLAALLSATNNFSSDNKLGEGGFGPVYKPHATQEEFPSLNKKESKPHQRGRREDFKELESLHNEEEGDPPPLL
ncbi:G-type lectin S-receptor-like serine/threonine-protein kinase [Vitis vinifera]|uniref:G-type lectin S-receptor-like serine/threonine-protein kinase n=1 Tax=Vitis vinifera TaxID=29760 RepID=A0A438G921_VITVI|nr:G-type lectin S-receptor-like serine/threonine-protein kinase [Vitis vinifera]